MQRRDVLKLAALSAGAAALHGPAAALPLALAAPALRAAAGPVPIIDAHIHLFDPLRLGGVPWPEKSDAALYKPTLPARYVAETAELGIVGAIAIEASPLASDNQWLLNVAATNPVIVGVVGDLVPGSPAYMKDLERLHGNALFLGIRYGNLWNRDLAADLENPGFVDGLKMLAAAGLVFESANPDPRLIDAIVEVAERVPDLRIVIDHLPHAPVPSEKDAQDQYWANICEAVGDSGARERKADDRPALLPGQSGCDLEYFWRGPYFVWERLAEQRARGDVCADVCNCARICGAEGHWSAREILLEELDCGLQMGATKFQSTFALSDEWS